MSFLYTVQVTRVAPGSVTLWVDAIHPDARAPRATPTFALMLIYDPIVGASHAAFEKYTHLAAAPLARAMRHEDYFDQDFLKANARAFVASVVGDDGELVVRATDRAWLEHLRVDMAWETAAYDSGPGLPTAPRAAEP